MSNLKKFTVNRLTIGVMILMFCFTVGTSNACVQISPDGETYTIDKSGCVAC